jgi:hypothetical protein
LGARRRIFRLGGVWNGQQILPQGLVDYMRSPTPASDEGQGPLYGQGQVWLARGQGFDLPALRMGMAREDIGFSNARLSHTIVAAGF